MDTPNSNSQQHSLLVTKLHAPLVGPKLISRTRLIARMHEGLSYKLTLISAPAGSGKTTLLSDWYASSVKSGMRVGWVSLDKHDNEPARFWTYVTAALEMLHVDSNTPFASSKQTVEASLIESVLPDLINTIASVPHTYVLVLDDYHEINLPAISEALTLLLDHLPNNLHVYLASRSDPPLPLARLRARNHLHEIRTNDLRFTTDEVTLFLQQASGLSLSIQQATALESRTEGWITGLQLAAIAMRTQHDIAAFIDTFAGNHRYIADYLFAEVLSQQAAHVQTFLLHTSVLERLTGPLCDMLLERDDGQTVLEQLEQTNLFIVHLDDQRHWYRYHQLFRDFLRNHLLRTQPGLIPNLYLRTSKWFENAGLLVEAIDYSLAANDFERGVALIEQIAHALLRQREIGTLLRWIEAIPETEIHARPRLGLSLAMTLVSVAQVDTAERILQHIEQIPEIASELALIRATIASMRGNAQQLIAFSQQAFEH